jgi:hypothetical protein
LWNFGSIPKNTQDENSTDFGSDELQADIENKRTKILQVERSKRKWNAESKDLNTSK